MSVDADDNEITSMPQVSDIEENKNNDSGFYIDVQHSVIIINFSCVKLFVLPNKLLEMKRLRAVNQTHFRTFLV